MLQILENSASLSREELVERTEASVAAFGRERRRNAELVHRLQQLHGEQVRLVTGETQDCLDELGGDVWQNDDMILTGGGTGSRCILMPWALMGFWPTDTRFTLCGPLSVTPAAAVQVDTLELKKRYHVLQAAHVAQAQLVNGGVEAAASPYRKQIKQQAQVQMGREGRLGLG